MPPWTYVSLQICNPATTTQNQENDSWHPVDGATSDASFSMDFVVKYGPVGWLMGVLMMKPMMRGVTRDILKGLAFHVTTGNTIGSEMPSAAALAAAVRQNP